MNRRSLDLPVPDPGLEETLTAGLDAVERLLNASVRSSSPFIDEAAGYLVQAGGKRFRPLLVHLAGLARDRGCGRLEWQVLDWNEPSIGFYRSLGAVPMSDWTTMRVTGRALDLLAGGLPEPSV